jgi:hypothetical protein
VSRGAKWMLLAICAAIAFAVVAAPAWLIQPFRPQTERGVAISHLLRQWSPLLTIVALAIIAALAFTL